ncbi:MAG: flagellar biosynthetic protein FliO [Cellulomonas sp.]|jgi:flagellar protein FliO/FliZ|uniref:flagellar biosynthetic protein FliO n=1 Tax=Cellulomonas sp. TaxID=40001 RepID=UPI001A0048F6|nr:flagellar biosynthetic protein FliO [Cellulomonas sp.]MBF0689175.1 flagellar biosynthetic protein FliO [Cellulomonas sp.]
MDELLLVGRVLLSLACVVGLVWYLARRFGAARPARDDREPSVRVVDRQQLSRTAGVAVVAVGSRRLLVGFGEQQVTMLTELRPVAEAAAPLPAAAHASAADPAGPAAAAPGPVGVTSGPLAGSVLSPATWRATLRVLQDRTVRR